MRRHRRRAENGSSRPFGVRLWAVGDEMYGDWQIGHMPLEKYVEKHRKIHRLSARVLRSAEAVLSSDTPHPEAARRSA